MGVSPFPLDVPSPSYSDTGKVRMGVSFRPRPYPPSRDPTKSL